MSKETRTRNLRYKRPTLDSIGWYTINTELYNIIEECSDISYFTESDRDTLLNALDGDEEKEYEFRMMFSELGGKAERLSEQLREYSFYKLGDIYDDCTVALIGNKYKTLGFDTLEEDYFSLTEYDQGLAFTESGKKIMRMTKQEMLSTIGQCMGIALAFVDVRQKYDYLKATFDILKDENTTMLQAIKEISTAYDEAAAEDFCEWGTKTRAYNAMLETVPQKMWLE